MILEAKQTFLILKTRQQSQHNVEHQINILNKPLMFPKLNISSTGDDTRLQKSINFDIPVHTAQ